MRIGMVGLGRMGANMTKRLIERGHEVVAFDLNGVAVTESAQEGAEGAGSLVDVVNRLPPPRTLWLMLPAGGPTVTTIDALGGMLAPRDVVVDGSNSYYRDGQRAAAHLRERGIAFLDCGVSGGVWGLRNGYCLTVGGEADAVRAVEPVFRDLAPEDGYAHVGPSGAGHYVKMIHNGIEYGMLQAYAEGFALLEAADELSLDLHQVATVWNHGSVVRSWLLELTELALANPADFKNIRGYVDDSGEGRWTVREAIERAISAPVITASLYARFASRDDEKFAARIVAALRNQFGGHKFFTEARAATGAAPEVEEAGTAAGPQSSATEMQEHP